MAKRITESRLLKWMQEKRLIGIPVGIALVIFMVYLGSIEVLEYTGDIQHNGTAQINITFEAKEDVFIYPMDASYTLLEFDNPQAVHLVKMYRTWGEGLRELNLSKKCTGSWCGCGWCTKSNTAEFVYAFRKGKEYTIVYDLELDPKADVKWSFLGDLVDPYLIGEKTTDDVFNTLTKVDNKGTMQFKMYSPSALDKSALTMKFKEVRGSVKDYNIKVLKNLTRVVDDYSIREVCTDVPSNKTKDVGASTVEVCHDESYVSGSHVEKYQEWVTVDSIPYGNEEYKIEADIQPEFYPNCPNNAKMCYAIDAIPVLDTGLETFEQEKWAWWNNSYDTKRPLNCTNMDNGVSLVINGSGGFDIDEDNQIVWTACQGDTTALYYNSGNSSSYVVVNDTRMPFEVEFGNGTSYSIIALWNNYAGVYHLTDDDDSTSYANDGTVGGATSGATGKIGDAYSFNGNDKITISGIVNDINNQSGMFSVWIKPTDTNALNIFLGIAKDDSDVNSRFRASIEADETAESYISGETFNSDGAVTVGSWVHYALRSDGSTSNMFINGVKQTNTGGAGIWFGDLAGLTKAFIGQRGYQENFWFTGVIDEFKFNQDTLTNDQINQTYQNAIGTAGFGDLGNEEPWPIASLTIEGYQRNITAELGSFINTSATITSGTVCVDIDHPSFGKNYSCGTDSTEFDLNIRDFDLTEFHQYIDYDVLDYNFSYLDYNNQQSTVYDIVGSNDGTLTNFNFNHGTVTSATWNATGFSSTQGAYEFEGVNDWIEIRDATEQLNCSNGCTISSWINKYDGSGSEGIYANYDTDDDNAFLLLYIDSGEDTTFIVGNGTDTTSCSYTLGDINLNTDYYITGIYNTTDIILYRDGTWLKTCPITFVPNWGIGTTEKTYLGTWNDHNSGRWTGTISQVQDWDKVLTPIEINQSITNTSPLHQPIGAWIWGNTDYNNDTFCPDVHQVTDSTVTAGGVDLEEAISFDGVDDYVTNVDIGNFSDMTISLWIKSYSNSNNWNRIYEYGDGRNSLGWWAGANKIYATIGGVNLNEYTFNIGDWIYSTVVYDSSANTMTHYINGEYWDSDTATMVDGNTGIKLGSREAGDRNFNGSIDEVKIFNQSLTAQQVSDLYTYNNEFYSARPYISPTRWTLSNGADKTLNISLDNRSTVLSAELQLNCSTSYCENVTINMTGYDYSFTKEGYSFQVRDTYYEDPWFKYIDTYLKLLSYTYPEAGIMQIITDIPEYPTYLTFNIDASEANAGNDLNRYDWFNTTDKDSDDATYGSTSNVTSQLAMFDNFATNTTNHWTMTESKAMSTYDEWSWTNSTTDDYILVRTRSDSNDLKEWRQVNSDDYIDFRNHSMIELRVAQWIAGGTGVQKHWGTTLIGIADGSTYVTISTHSESSFYSCNDYYLNNFTLIRTTKDTNSWKLYIDGVYSNTISTSTLDDTQPWTLKLYTTDKVHIGEGSGSWGQSNYAGIALYYIKKGGMLLAKNYTEETYNSTSGQFISKNLTTQPNNIDSATLKVTAYIPSGTTLDYYLSNNDTWEAVTNNVLHGFTTTGKNLTYRIDFNTTNASVTPEVYDVQVMITSLSLENITIYSDTGTNLWNKTGVINSSNTPLNVSIDISADTAGTTKTLIIESDSSGVLNISNFAMNSTLKPIILINTTFEDQTITHINISYDNTTTQTLDVNFTLMYIGGNKTYTVLAHNTDYSSNDSYDITYSYSSFNLSLPQYVDYEEFIPQTPTSKNVTPYKQTSSVPIYNISITGYAGAINLSFNLNETHSCVNLTYDTDNNKAGGQQFTADTWYNVVTNQVYGYNFGVWLWEDYGCNRTYWEYWNPWLDIRPCCVGCDVCSDEVI